MGNRIYGCDDCLAVCPWNKYAKLTREAKLASRDDLAAPVLEKLAKLDDAEFRTFFKGSPIKRIGRNRFMRNVLIAIGNSSKSNLLELVKPHLSDQDPIVRGAAVWAYRQLEDDQVIANMRLEAIENEADESVRLEWVQQYV